MLDQILRWAVAGIGPATETKPDPVIPKIPYKADDLPAVIRGRVTKEDISNASSRRMTSNCLVATALKRLYPGIDGERFFIGVTDDHYIGNRRYEADRLTQVCISNWVVYHMTGRLNMPIVPFDFTLEEID